MAARGVTERSIGAAEFGAVRVAGGALKVLEPRLPTDEPPPGRAQASTAPTDKAAASAANKANFRNFMSTLPAPSQARRRQYGEETIKTASRTPLSRRIFRPFPLPGGDDRARDHGAGGADGDEIEGAGHNHRRSPWGAEPEKRRLVSMCHRFVKNNLRPCCNEA
ncbi:MAG: hypothetical protein V9G24_18160 [Rhodoblastus sp.]